MTEELSQVEAEINEEEVAEDIISEEVTEEAAEEVVEDVAEDVEEVEAPKPQPKKLDKFAKKLAELNELKRNKETLELERDIALIKAKYGNEVDEGRLQEIKLKHKDLSMDEVYAIYAHSDPKPVVEQPKPTQPLRVVWQKPVHTTKVYTYDAVSKLTQAEYNKVMELKKQGKVIIKSL